MELTIIIDLRLVSNNFALCTVRLCVSGRVTCSTGGLCSVVVGVTVVWTVEPCLIIVVGVTGRASIDVPGACRIIAQKAENL